MVFDTFGHGAQRFFEAFVSRLRLFAEPKDDALTVGIGGDIPIFPPFVAVGSVMLGNIIMKISGKRARFLPESFKGFMRPMPIRIAIFMLMAAIGFGMKGACDRALEAAGSHFDFVKVGGIADTGPYAYSRNPMYPALCSLPIAMAFVFDNAWILLTSTILPVYIHLIVVPAEESYLQSQEHLREAYAAYCARVPRYHWLIPL